MKRIFYAKDRETVALCDFSLQIRRGEILALMGVSGCGKTTALSLLAGLDSPTEGLVLFKGTRIEKPGTDRTLVLQKDTAFPWLTVYENMLYASEISHRQQLHGFRRTLSETLGMSGIRGRSVGSESSSGKAALQAREWLRIAGLSDFSRSLPKALSGGMRKRLELARAYAANPEMLLLDEPFASLDPLNRQDMHSVLLDMWRTTGHTILMVTHDPAEGIALADRIAVMTDRPGKVKEIIQVDLPHPRTGDVRRSREYLHLEDHVREAISTLSSRTNDEDTNDRQ